MKCQYAVNQGHVVQQDYATQVCICQCIHNNRYFAHLQQLHGNLLVSISLDLLLLVLWLPEQGLRSKGMVHTLI